jgi:hypothetical protein
MGTCVSTVLPRRVFGTRREGSPSGRPRIPHSDDSDGEELPGEPNGKELPGGPNGKELPDSINSKHLPNGTHNKHFPDEGHNKRVPDDAHNNHHPDDVHHKTKDVEAKRRALLVGITYTNPWNTWSQLDGPHGDVDQYRGLLISA